MFTRQSRELDRIDRRLRQAGYGPQKECGSIVLQMYDESGRHALCNVEDVVRIAGVDVGDVEISACVRNPRAVNLRFTANRCGPSHESASMGVGGGRPREAAYPVPGVSYDWAMSYSIGDPQREAWDEYLDYAEEQVLEKARAASLPALKTEGKLTLLRARLRQVWQTARGWVLAKSVRLCETLLQKLKKASSAQEQVQENPGETQAS